jgi:S-(hydroxymethyl)glutathione dehydrogenase/alcohol dehydrogenase
MGAVRNVARVRRGESVAVIGCGGVGLQVVAGARLAGADPIVAVDRVPEKLELARAQGATHVVDVAAEADPAAAVRAITDGGVDHAFEVIGRPETIRLAWEAARRGGSAIVVGLAAVGVEASVPAIDFLSDKSLLGTYYGSGDPAAELPELAGLVLSRALDLERVVTHTAPLEGVGEALDRLRRGEGARTVLLVDPDLAGRPASVKEDSA